MNWEMVNSSVCVWGGGGGWGFLVLIVIEMESKILILSVILFSKHGQFSMLEGLRTCSLDPLRCSFGGGRQTMECAHCVCLSACSVLINACRLFMIYWVDMPVANSVLKHG